MLWNDALSALCAGISIIHHQPQLDDHRAALGRPVQHFQEFERRIQQAGESLEDRDDRRQRSDKMRRVLDQTVALLHGLPHQAELAVLQVADAAVGHVGRGGARPRTKITPLHEQDVHAVQCKIAKGANAIDAPANDQHRDVRILLQG